MTDHLRSGSAIKFAGFESDRISGAKLPLVNQVFSYFMYQHRTLNKTIRESARAAVREVVSKFWSKTTVPIVQEIQSIAKIESLHKQYKVLLKSSTRDQEEAVDKFTTALNSFF